MGGGGEMTKIAINCSKIREILSITREPWVYGPCPQKSVRVTEIPWGLATLDTHIGLHRTHRHTHHWNRHHKHTDRHTHIHKIHTTNTRRAPQDTYTHTRAHRSILSAGKIWHRCTLPSLLGMVLSGAVIKNQHDDTSPNRMRPPTGGRQEKLTPPPFRSHAVSVYGCTIDGRHFLAT